MSSKLLRRLLLIPVLLFVGLELLLWAFIRIPLEPLKTLHLSNDLPGLKREVTHSFDRLLARYLDNTHEDKPAGTVRILCIGGSGTFALLQNADDTWWGRLGRDLQSKGHPVQVAGWGQDRIGIVASIPFAATLMEEWQPDLVIANFGFDDVVGQPLEFQYQPEKARGPGPLPGTAGWKQALLKVSQTARLVRWWGRRNEAAVLQDKAGRAGQWSAAFAKLQESLRDTAPVDLPARDPVHDPLFEYLDGWKVLHDFCGRYGARLIMTSEASLHRSTNSFSEQERLVALVPVSAMGGPDAKYMRPSPAWVEGQMKRYAQAAESFAVRHNIPWINLQERIPGDLTHFYSDVILTDAGAAALAAQLLPVVESVLARPAGSALRGAAPPP